jgi:hypothetical protein
MVYFQTKNYTLGPFLRSLHRIENVALFYGHLECLRPFGIFYGHFVMLQ